MQDLLYKLISPVVDRKLWLEPGRALVKESTSLIEKGLMVAVNAERQKRRLCRLVLDERLVALARDHSADMARQGFFAHVNREGLDSNGRAKNYGLHGAGDNIAAMPVRQHSLAAWYSVEELIRNTHTGWMESPGHKKNLLLPQYSHIGLGVIYNGHEHYLITQNLY